MTEFRAKLRKPREELWLGVVMESLSVMDSRSGRQWPRVRFKNCPYVWSMQVAEINLLTRRAYGTDRLKWPADVLPGIRAILRGKELTVKVTYVEHKLLHSEEWVIVPKLRVYLEN